MPRRQAFLVPLLLLAAHLATADDAPKRVDSALHFITDAETIFVNIDNDPFAAWVKPIFTALETQFANETKPRSVIVEITLHADRPAEVIVAGRPALSAIENNALLKAADPAKSPRTKIVDSTMEIRVKINGGTPDKSGPMVPPLVTLGNRRLAIFKPLPTPEKRAQMRKWARTDAIPLLAEIARRRDQPKDAKIRSLGQVLGDLKRDGPIDVAGLTEKNPDFWWTLLTAPQGDPLAAATRVALLVANGEIRRARQVANAVAPFCDNKWAATRLLADFVWMDDVFVEDVEVRVREGIALHDKGQFDVALKVYEAVLKDDPKSAHALYERFQTTLAKALKNHVSEETAMKDWAGTRKAILDADPMYPWLAVASGRDEAYDLLLRRELSELYKDRGKFVTDALRYADIALELGEPCLAAIEYASILRSIKPEAYGGRNIIADMLYCFEQLDAKEIKKAFKGDHAAEFKRIDAAHLKARRESVAYRKFNDSNPPQTKDKP